MFKLKSNSTFISAHSGAEKTPPNSLDFIETAARCDADAVELDLRISRDGTLLFSHDPELSKPGVVGRYIKSIKDNDFTFLEQAFGIPEAEKLMDRALELGLRLNIDVKDRTCLKELHAYLISRNALDRCVLTGLHFPHVRSLGETLPGLNILLGLDHELEGRTDKQNLRLLKRAAVFIRENKCVGINVELAMLSPEGIELLHKEGVLVSVWTVRSREELDRALALGADMITSDILSSGPEDRKKKEIVADRPRIC